MKYCFRNLSLLLLASLLLVSADALGQRQKYPEFHYVTLPISVGYSSYLSPGFKNEPGFENFSVPGKVGATVGLGYEYRYRKFWLSVGIEGQLFTSRLRPGVAQIDTMVYDSDLDQTNPQRENRYSYHISKWNDDQLAIYGNVPLMVGVRFNAFYIGVGAKVGYSFYATSTPSATYTTTSHYDRFIDDFVGMPNHYLTNYNSGLVPEENYNLEIGLNVAAIAEIGYEVYHSEGSKHVRPWILKLGAYAEYGFLSAYTNSGNVKQQLEFKNIPDPVDPSNSTVQDPSQILLRPFYKCHDTRNVAINPLYVGAKLTFMFDLPVPQKCHCLQSERGASWRNMAPKPTKSQNKHAKKKVKKQGKKMKSADKNSNLR